MTIKQIIERWLGKPDVDEPEDIVDKQTVNDDEPVENENPVVLKPIDKETIEKYESQKDKNKQKRICPCCGRELYIEQFTRLEKDETKRDRICVDCAYHLRTYNKRDLISRLKTCSVFTGIFNKTICDFHHQFGEKSFSLSNRKKKCSPGIIFLEAFKCIISDSNCHRLLHKYYKEGEEHSHDDISYRRDHNDSYLLIYYVNFINECYSYIKLLFGDYKMNFEVYIPNPEFSVKKQVKEARMYIYLLLTLIITREKTLDV